MSLKTLSDVRFLELARHARDDGELVVLEQSNGLPFAASRMFTVRAAKDAVRGRHAHRLCSQAMICLDGAIDVECDDGAATHTFRLERPNLALLVPPSIWATETYHIGRSILMVLCDRPFEESDYIHDYAEFLAWRKNGLLR